MVTDLVPENKQGSFGESVRDRAAKIRSWLCVGIDPDVQKLPTHLDPTVDALRAFCEEIVVATSPYAACFKINVAFFEVFGSHGWRALEELRAVVPSGVPVMLDAKRGDIGNTSAAYATALFDHLGADAVTVSPYLGWDSLEPFLSYANRGVFVLCRTSNPGSRDLQELAVDGEPLYLRIARQAIALESPASVGLVVGATQPDALRRIRALDAETVLLSPGVGAQGASAREAIEAGGNAQGDNVLASVSRDILYSSRGPDFAESAARAAARWAAESWEAREAISATHR
jgi:orotidine-5'-phosphate decarboxylase